MSLAAVVAAIMFVGVIAYAVFAGADFGFGVWDLTAGDAQQGAETRSLIDESIGPVWEANHVWLIFVLVYLWTAFPMAFAAIFETLFVPLTLAAFGIILRGSAFAFRKLAPTVAKARLFGAIFAMSSVLTPFFFGVVASGRVPLAGSAPGCVSQTRTRKRTGDRMRRACRHRAVARRCSAIVPRTDRSGPARRAALGRCKRDIVVADLAQPAEERPRRGGGCRRLRRGRLGFRPVSMDPRRRRTHRQSRLDNSPRAELVATRWTSWRSCGRELRRAPSVD